MPAAASRDDSAVDLGALFHAGRERMIGGVTRRISSPEFVGRQVEIERLALAFDGALAGRDAVVLISGEAGIGKSRLAKEFDTMVRARVHVAAGGG